MRYLKKIIDKRSEYNLMNIVKTLFLASNKSMGRASLMNELNLNEAPVKTMLKNLSRKGILISDSKGSVLTKKGEKIIYRIKKNIPCLPTEIDAKNYADYGIYKRLYKKRHDIAIIVKNCASKIHAGIEQRDAAIRFGAIGATTLIQKKGKILFPESGYKIDYGFNNYLKEKLKLSDGDVLIICFGPSKFKSEEAALGVALSLVEK